jgi:predicted PurR-regulated permease PerM
MDPSPAAVDAAQLPDDQADASKLRRQTSREGRSLRRFRSRWMALVAATVICLYLCWLMLQPFLTVLLWGIVLAIVFYPLHAWIERRTGHPAWAAALSCLTVVAVVLVPLALVTIAVVNEAATTFEYLQKNAGSFINRDAPFFVFLRQRNVDVDNLISLNNLVERLQSVAGDIARGVPGLVTDVVGTFLKILFVILTMYYLFRDGKRIRLFMLESLPLEPAQSAQIFNRTEEVIGASVYGVLVVASIQAVLGEIGFLAAGLRAPLLWGVLLFFFSMIPVAGSFLVWVPACLVLLANGHWIKAALLAAWCMGVVGMIDNVLRPRLVGKRTRLHELVVFFSVLGGLQVFGGLGLVVGPVVVAITLALLDIFRKADRGLPSSVRTPVKM